MIGAVTAILLLVAVTRASTPDLCVDEVGMLRSSFLILGPVRDVFRWSSSIRSSGGGAVAMSVFTENGALGWVSRAGSTEVPKLPKGSVLYGTTVPSASTIDSIKDTTTKALARFFTETKRKNPAVVTESETINGTLPEGSSSTWTTDGQQEDESESSGSYNDRPLTGLFAITQVEVNHVSRSKSARWSVGDQREVEGGTIKAAVALSFLAAAHFCKSLSWLIDIVPYNDPRATVTGFESSVSLHDRNAWLQQLSAASGTTPEAIRGAIATKWNNSGVPVSADNVIVALSATERTDGPCGLSDSRGYVMTLARHGISSGCHHWKSHTVLMHELLHLFGACDEYGACTCWCDRDWCRRSAPPGCYTNANCPNCIGHNRCVMQRGESKACVCASTALQVGWGVQQRSELAETVACKSVPSLAVSDSRTIFSFPNRVAVASVLIAIAMAETNE